MPRGPLADSYPGTVALVVCSLAPYLVLSAGFLPLLDLVAKGTGLIPHALGVTLALSTAALAPGRRRVEARGRR